MNHMKIAAFALTLALAATMSSSGFAADYGARAVKSFAQAERGDLVVPARSDRRGNFGRNFRRGGGHKFRGGGGHRFRRGGGHKFRGGGGHRFRGGGGHRFRHGGGHRFRHGHSSFSFAFVFPFYYFFPYYHYPYYPYYGHGSYSYYGHHSSHQTELRRCRPVTGTGRDRYGRKAKFGGTMCYDRYGNAYILRGSRHIIHYYN